MKGIRRKRPHKIFVLCGKWIYDIFALFLMKGSALEHRVFSKSRFWENENGLK